MDELQGPMPDGGALSDAPFDVSGDYGVSSGAGDLGLSAKDGLTAFNNALSAWLKHDTASMQQTQPVAYGGVRTALPAQQANRNLLLLIGLAVLAFVVLEAEHKS